ncbi:hypothetical protein OWP15_11620 [Bacillus paranthracis]|uniref:hypothetical protein n=1 Tax=Bacillus paranthracis TaxID=2026186 RepID=UPI000789F62B|nr:hypothetical protein [Bacillus paranthracis]KYQ01874.1 hypothetical protein B4079_3156 [Bacillus cereus]MDK7473363.1 hypothetical protein [Bacillus paranthracis]
MEKDFKNYTLYAIRANDLYPSISQIINAEISTKLKNTRNIGVMSQIIKLLKVAPQVIELDKVEYMCANVGIDEHALRYYLKEIYDLGYINLNEKRVESSIPLSSLEIYEGLGYKLEYYNPSEFELQHFELLNTIAELPTRASAISEIIDLQPKDLQTIKNIGGVGGYLESYISPADASEILFSPLYWDENPDKLFSLVEKYQEDQVLSKIKAIRRIQGKPVNSFSDDPILTEAIAIGCLPTNSVTSLGGEQYFAFTPNLGVKIYEKDMVRKARQIVASVRYGENFAVITKIISATAVLKKLMREGFIGAHTENIHQYALLIQMGLVYPVKSFGDRHAIHLNDTPENRRIFELALELLENGTLSDDHAQSYNPEDLKKIFKEGRTFSSEIIVRPKFKKEVPLHSDNLQKLGDIIRGVDVDVFK